MLLNNPLAHDVQSTNRCWCFELLERFEKPSSVAKKTLAIGFYLLIVALVLLLEMIGRPQESLFHNQPGAQNREKETLAAELKSR